jgi:hypothetical protein
VLSGGAGSPVRAKRVSGASSTRPRPPSGCRHLTPTRVRILYGALLLLALAACSGGEVCTYNADCDHAEVCLSGICAAPCNTDCDCPANQTCGPFGACIGGGASTCTDGLPITCGGADLTSDPENCGSCGTRCAYPKGIGVCTGGECSLDRCTGGHHDIDGDPRNGCEYACSVDLNAPNEVCDNRDNDCDGAVDEGLLETWYLDADDDRHGTPLETLEACAQPPGYSANDKDCDDGDPARFEGNPELCDGIDNDCDTEIDEGLSQDYWRDLDEDGHGAGSPSSFCLAPPGFVAVGDDCDDEDDERFPGNPEVCDSKDNNCVAGIDEGVLTPFYLDNDGDGHGDIEQVTLRCEAADGEVGQGDDCDDNDDERTPGRPEVCDDKDNNCVDGLNDEPYIVFYQDLDGDQYGTDAATQNACARPAGFALEQDDCADDDAARNPGAAEVCDGVDNNCRDGIDEGHPQVALFPDGDGDGFGATGAAPSLACVGVPGWAETATDCDDSDDQRFPGAPEWCDGVDQDCNLIDDDNLSIRLVSSTAVAPLNSDLLQLRTSDGLLSWSRLDAGQTLSVRAQTLPGGAVDIEDQTVRSPVLQLPDLGEGARQITDGASNCLMRTPGGAWQPLALDGCRLIDACPVSAGGQETTWRLLLGSETPNGNLEVGLWDLSAAGEVTLHNLLPVDGTAMQQGLCAADDYLALVVSDGGNEKVLAGPAAGQEVGVFSAPLRQTALLRSAQTNLLAIAHADGSVETVQLDEDGTLLSSTVISAPPRIATGVVLLPITGGALLGFALSAPAFEAGARGVAIGLDGVPVGSEARLSETAAVEQPLAALAAANGGGGEVWYGEATQLQKLSMSCLPP